MDPSVQGIIKVSESLRISKTDRNLVGLVCLIRMNPAHDTKQQAFLDVLSSYFYYGTHKVRSSEDLKKRIQGPALVGLGNMFGKRGSQRFLNP
jgi:hypothetical protein